MYGFDYDQVEAMERQEEFLEGLEKAQQRRIHQRLMDDEDRYDPCANDCGDE